MFWKMQFNAMENPVPMAATDNNAAITRMPVERQVGILLGAFLFLLIYDGALRKWLFPGAEKLLFIAKDAVLLLAAGCLVLARSRIDVSYIPRAIAIPFLAYAAWVIGEAANPKLPSLLVGLWGIKAHLFYACVILLIPLAFSNLEKMFSWIEKIYPWLVIPVCAVAWVQFYSPMDSLANLPVRGGVSMVSNMGGADGHIRAAGTFSYISGMGSFLQAATIVGFALLLRGGKAYSIVPAWALVMATVPTNGSRGVVYVVVAAFLIMLVGALYLRLLNRRVAAYLLAAIAGVVLISAISQQAAWRDVLYRMQTSYTTVGDSQRYLTVFTNAFDSFRDAGLVGFGSGATSQAAPFLVSGVEPYSWIPAGIFREDESGRVVIELGAIGWGLSMAMRLAFLAWALFLGVRGVSSNVKWAALLTLPFLALGVYVGNGVFAPPVGAVFYWFCVAMLSMAQRERADARAVGT